MNTPTVPSLQDVQDAGDDSELMAELARDTVGEGDFDDDDDDSDDVSEDESIADRDDSAFEVDC